MAARKVTYVDVKVADPGRQAAAVLKAVADAGISLQAFTAFPTAPAAPRSTWSPATWRSCGASRRRRAGSSRPRSAAF